MPPAGSCCAALGGFSLHVDIACEAWERDKLERLCHYVARSAIANERLFQRPDGLVVYKMKKPYHDGTEYLLLSPEELLEKLAALVTILQSPSDPFSWLSGPHAKMRKKVVPAREVSETSKPSQQRMPWAQLLKRVFKIEIDICRRCGGKLKVIATIMKSDVIERILKHLRLPFQPLPIFPPRASPQRAWEF